MANGVIGIDMSKAKDIYKDVLRSARQPLLDQLDTKFMRAVESGNTALQSAIAEQKQELRDLPANPAIETANTVNDLKQIWPEVLTQAGMGVPPTE